MAAPVVAPMRTPRPYQQRAVRHTKVALNAGQRVCLVAPTGAGKTYMMDLVLQQAARPVAFAHTQVLVSQLQAALPYAEVFTLQLLLSRGPNGAALREYVRRADMAAFDEIHHLGGEQWREAAALFEGVPLFGPTATPQRADGSPLGDVLDHLVVAASYSELLDGGWLARCDVHRPDYSRKEQKKLEVRPDGVAAYLRLARAESGGWRPGIYFDSTIALCEDAAKRLNARGVRAALVCERTSPEERRELFAAFDSGELDVLTSPSALSEGFDAPRAKVCVLRRSAQHVGPYLQMAGRVLRAYQGERALLIDCTDARSIHGYPTDDRRYSLEGRGIERLEDVPLEQLGESEMTEEQRERRGLMMVEARYQLVRDTLLDRYRELVRQATERGYKLGWVFHRMRQATGLSELPRTFAAKYRSVCVSCRHRVTLGEPILWDEGEVHHPDCWFSALDRERLRAADALSPPVSRVFPDPG